MIHFPVESNARCELIGLNERINRLIHEQEWDEGVLYLFCTHTTAGLTINEGADPAVRRDILDTLSKLVPHRLDYRHQEGNSDAHIKATLTGFHLALPVEHGRLLLGTWQTIYLCEFDGPRLRNLLVSFIAAC